MDKMLRVVLEGYSFRLAVANPALPHPSSFDKIVAPRAIFRHSGLRVFAQQGLWHITPSLWPGRQVKCACASNIRLKTVPIWLMSLQQR